MVAAEHVLSAGAGSDQAVGRVLDPDQPLVTYPTLQRKSTGIYCFPCSEKCISPGHPEFPKKTK